MIKANEDTNEESWNEEDEELSQKDFIKILTGFMKKKKRAVKKDKKVCEHHDK